MDRDNLLEGAALSRRAALRALGLLGLLAACPVAADTRRREARAAEATYQDVSTRAEEGCGATRIVTPYYSVFLESSLFPDGVAYNYVENVAAGELSDDAVSAGVAVFGALEVYAVTRGQASSVIAASPCRYLFCAPVGLGPASPFAQEGVALPCLPLPAASGCAVYACAPVGDGVRDEAQARAEALRAHVFIDAGETALTRGGSSTRVTTPCYAVDVPDALFPGGWYYTYVRDGSAADGQDGSAGQACTLAVVPVGETAPAFYVARVPAGSAPVGAAATWEVAGLDGSWAGQSVVAYVDAGGDAGRLEAYAGCVSCPGAA